MLGNGDLGFEGLAAVDDADELCRRLVAAPWGWRSSTRHMEGVALLAQVHGTGELPDSFVALLLCACRRWRRVTARLIAAIEDCGLLGDVQLDELAESLLCQESVVSYPLSWISPQALEIDVEAGSSRALIADEDALALAQHRLSLAPPLRRWAAHRALNTDPARLDDLLRRAETFAPRHRAALIHGVLDAADALDESGRRAVVDVGLQTAQTGVRRTALDRLCELDGPVPALRRARADNNACVRTWQPRHPEPAPVQSTFAI